jgi:hypothetical protein
MIGTSLASMIAITILIAGFAIGLLVSGLILRKRLTVKGGLGASLLSCAAFISVVVWLNCDSFENGVCVDTTYSNFHNQLVSHSFLWATIFACLVASLLSLCLRALDHTHKPVQGKQNV